MTTNTTEQDNIIRWVQESQKSLVVQAGPGCGKTYTNVRTMFEGGPGYKMGIAFNKSIADELRTKAPPSVDVKTSHSVGLQMLKAAFRSKVNPASPYSKTSKAYKVVQSVFPNKFADSFGAIANCLTTGMDLLGLGAEETVPADWTDLVAELQVSNEEREQLCQRLPVALERYCQETEEVSFADMLILPIRYDLRPPFPQTRIWGDEIQDWSPTQIKMVTALCGANTLVYGFGDKYQSIYAFRGADVHALERFKETFSAETLPLTTSFRCPQRVIEIAQRRNPRLTWPEAAPLGVVDHWDHSQVTPAAVTEDTMILCRLNSPLFALGLRFLAAGHPVRVSSNLPSSLKNIIRSLKTDNMTVFKERLEVWFREQLDFAGDNHHLQGAANDKYSALVSLHRHSESVSDMGANIDRLTRGHEGPLLSTVHKAKGLEADRVILLKSSMLTWPGEEVSGRDLTEDQLEQEWNVWFVAVTRSKNELFFA